MKKSTIIIIVILIFGILVAAGHLLSTDKGNSGSDAVAVRPTADPIDVAIDFSNRWLTNVQATTSLSLSEFIAGESIVTEALAADLVARPETELDPLLCQPTTPKRVGGKQISVTDTSAEVMVLARGGEKTPNLAVVTLAAQNGEWVVADVQCSYGEAGPPVGEFTFTQVGRLAKESVPERYDNSNWHLLFTGVDGRVQIVTLLFDESTECIAGADSAACSLDSITEGVSATVFGNLTEAGASVVRLELE